MFYILISMHVTTLKPQHPLFELFHSYPALSVTSDWGCNGQHVREAEGGVDCPLNQESFSSFYWLFVMLCAHMFSVIFEIAVRQLVHPIRKDVFNCCLELSSYVDNFEFCLFQYLSSPQHKCCLL